MKMNKSAITKRSQTPVVDLRVHQVRGGISFVMLLLILQVCACHGINIHHENEHAHEHENEHENIQQLILDLEHKPMPMHQHFTLQRQLISLLSKTSSSKATATATAQSSSSLSSNRYNNQNQNRVLDENYKYFESPYEFEEENHNDGYGGSGGDGEDNDDDVLGASWWFRLKEGDQVPETRRSHHSTMYSIEKEMNMKLSSSSTSSGNVVGNGNDNGSGTNKHKNHHTGKSRSRNRNLKNQMMTMTQEYMIVTGGFSDYEWHTFPIFAYDVTKASLNNEGKWYELKPNNQGLNEDEYEQICYNPDDLTNFNVVSSNTDTDTDTDTNTDNEDVNVNGQNGNESNATSSSSSSLWDNASLPCHPPARVGHISVVRNDHLYVFGGLLYNEKEGVFYMEDAPFMYRIKLSEDEFRNDNEANTSANSDYYKDVNVVDGEHYKDDIDGNQNNTNTKDFFGQQMMKEKVMIWERIMPNVKNPPQVMASPTSTADDTTPPRPQDILNRGEVRGGYWEKQDKLIVYGGLHVRDYQTLTGREQQADYTLGDVWSYDFKTDTWEMISSPAWSMTASMSSSGKSKKRDHPGDRTSHTAVVVGDELVIYGGLKKVDTFLWDGSTIWEQLDDVWIFDLNTHQWKEREMAESMGRAYHSLVGWETGNVDGLLEGEGTVIASFGGYKTITDPIDNQQISYVYDDTLVTFPPPPTNDTSTSLWFLATYEGVEVTIPTRLEHTAVLSKAYGNMIVWGGRYRLTSEIHGVWSLNINGADSNVLYMIRGDDDDVENVGVAYVVLFTVMLMSMMFTYMCGLLHRTLESEEGQPPTMEQVMDPNNAFGFARRNGLHQDIIDTLPLKTYQHNSLDVDAESHDNSKQTNDGNTGQNNQVSTAEDTFQSDDNGYDAEDDDNCCPICLVEYSNGEEIRCLPCEHEFHKSCVDAWLGNNASCPACRHSLQELASLTTRNTPVTDDAAIEGENEGEADNDARNRGIGVSFPQFFSRIGRARQREVTSVPSNDSSISSPPEIQPSHSSSNTSYDSDSIGDLGLSYSSSLDLSDTGMPQDQSRGRRNSRRFRPIQVGPDDLPVNGRSRRMRTSAVERRRNRGRRLAGRRRAGATSLLNDPLQRTTDGSIV